VLLLYIILFYRSAVPVNNAKVANEKCRLYLTGMADKQLLISVLALRWSRKRTLIDDTSFVLLVCNVRQLITLQVKVKQSRYRPGVAQRVPGN